MDSERVNFGNTHQTDPIVLGEGYILSGNDVGITRPNDNVLIDGCSGVGKTTSTQIPTMLLMSEMNPIASFAKEEEAVQMANYLRAKGYQIEILNLNDPGRSTVSFDPLLLIRTQEDIEEFSAAAVNSVLEKTNDSYWNSSAKSLNSALVYTAKMKGENIGTDAYLRLFDKTVPEETNSGFSTQLHPFIRKLRDQSPHCYSTRMFNAWASLPFRTASCVRDTLATALSIVFPEAVRKMMRDRSQINFEKLATERKKGLFIISDAAEPWQAYYLNLFWSMGIRKLRAIAKDSPENRLPIPVRMYFGDFGCTCPIQNFEKNISVFRSAGISCFIVLQSQSQLESIYGTDKAAIIRQNCPVQVYFPGGFDDRSCELVSRRMNMPFEDVMYAPLGKVFIMQTGRKPVIVSRYDTYHSKEYQTFLETNRKPLHR